MKRIVIAAAVQDPEGKVTSLLPPKRHHHIMASLIRYSGGFIIRVPQVEQGFLDNYGKFMTCEEAFDVANVAGQFTKKPLAPPRLFSEDLW